MKMASCLRLQVLNAQKLRPLLSIRQISTSKKNNETVAVTDADKQECKTKVPAKNWVTYGFDRSSEAADRSSLHLTFFGSITLCLVFGGFLMWYAPDVNLKDWAQREAFIELRRREAEGLPLIDKNLVDPAKIALPDDEELGDTEIII